jgi:signal peptidase I
MHPRLRSVLGWVVFVLAVVLVSTVARAYAVQTYFVPTPSMTPTLIPGDRIVVDKLASTIHRGDIVVFNNVPADDGGPEVLVKRVIGLPGETISSVGATVLINGKPLPEAFLPPLTGICAEVDEHIKTTKIPPGHYFMMGDCRGDSGDSRYWGTVPASYIIGKVDLIIWRNGHPWFHWF